MYRILTTLLLLHLFLFAKGDAPKKPKIVGQNFVSTTENDPIDISLNDLIVEYEDDEDGDSTADDPMLTVDEGKNYTVSGTTVTPDVDYVGTLSVPVQIDNNGKKSNKYDLQVEVEQDENDAPVITAQANSLQAQEEQSLTISLGDLVVSDPDNIYPDDFSLTVYAGSNYNVSGTTITPATDFYGTLTVTVSVHDGTNESNTFDLSIDVTNVNDAPAITGQQLLAINENESLDFQFAYLTVSDVDNTYPDGFTLSLSDGDNYSISGNTIIPDANFSGSITVPATVNDGLASSNTFNVAITVNAVNNAPTITGQSTLATNEDQSISLSVSDFTIDDSDNSSGDFLLSVQTGSNYTVSGNVITPSENFYGTLTVPVTVSDGSATSGVFNAAVTVQPVNDAPAITGQSALQTAEGQAITLALSNLIVTDVDNTYPDDFSLVIQSGSDYTFSGTTITPVANFNGTLSVPVYVYDGSANSNTYSVQISVSNVNSAPVITGQAAVQISEDQSVTLSLNDLIVTDNDNTYPTGFSMSAQSGENYSVSGLTITPVANFNGTLTVPVTVNDGAAESNTYSLQITVIAQNDPPSITGQVSLSTNEDTPITIALEQLTVVDIDNSFPTGFTLSVSAGDNYTVSGQTVTPSTNFNGTLTVPVTVSDGIAQSNVFNLSITVNAVNNPPVIIGQTDLSTEEETPIEISLSNLKVIDPDNTYPNGFSLTISSGSNYTVSGFTITPAANFAGDLTVPVTVNDGTSNSAPFNLRISVIGENDPPVITGQTPLSIPEDQTLTIKFANLTVTDTDNTYPNGFSISFGNGENYSVSDGKIIPSANFNGTLTIPTWVSDGINGSNTFDVIVSVTPVNDAPVITGQEEITSYKNKSVTLDLLKLKVSDPDNNFPDDFTATFQKGVNYLVFDNTITPTQDFIGELSIPVTVSDGALNSNVFDLKINIIQPPNVAPVITSQVTLTTYENQSLELQLSNLVVVDPDNKYPDDFTLKASAGEHFSLNGNVVTPEKDFSGLITVPVTVSDPELTSNVFQLKINVLPVANVPLISSQSFLRMNEDDSLTIEFSQLQVVDPDDNYPLGFTMNILDGEHYNIDGLTVKPERNYNGYLTVPVTVSDGENTSAPYLLLILVEPEDDAPQISYDGEVETFFYALGKDALKIFEKLLIQDVDDDSIAFAEITIAENQYRRGVDSLFSQSSEAIRSIFDGEQGLLLLFGKAPLVTYQQLIRSVAYEFSGTARDPAVDTKIISVTLNDGQNASNTFSRTVSFSRQAIILDIPTGFTPNGDGANDTWNIKGLAGNETFSDAVIRVYNRQGSLVFEARGFDTEWDGRMNGVVLPADIYFYTIDLNGTDMRNRYHGAVTILR